MSNTYFLILFLFAIFSCNTDVESNNVSSEPLKKLSSKYLYTESTNFISLDSAIVSAEMKEFISSMKGDYKKIEMKLMQYGISEEVFNHEIGSYNLENPKIIDLDNNCYTISAETGMLSKKYTICWDEKVIVSIN
jgi:hypothetical protein